MTTVARISRPPGYDMTYRPKDRAFGPPWLKRFPSLLYLGFAVLVSSLVLIAERSPAGSWLYEYFIARDVYRVVGSRALSLLLLGSAVAAVIRSGMGGVRVRGDGVESREVLNLLWPRVRSFKWAQIDCIVLDQQTAIAIDLWDGSRAFLPEVNDRDGLAQKLEWVAAARAIPVRGGRGLDEVPDVIPPEADDSE